MKTINFTIQIGKSLSAIKAQVTIWGISESGQTQLGSFQMNALTESFDIENDSFKYYFATASIHEFTSNDKKYLVSKEHPIQLLAIFEQARVQVLFNEYLTIANAFCFTQSMQIDADGDITLSNTDRVLGLSMGMRNNLSDDEGNISTVISSSPNGLETNSYPLWMSLANLMYNSLCDGEVYKDFRKYTRINKEKPVTFLAALYNIIRNPFTRVSKIYGLIADNPVVFHPSLTELDLPKKASPKPNNWTLAIKIHHSGADNYLIAGPAQIVFDKNDRGWVANNVLQGTPNSAAWCPVFEPNGKPAHFSPVFGGGILGVGFGVTVDNEGENIYFGSYGWGPTQCNPHKGAVAHFTQNGETKSPTNGHTEGLSRVQGLGFDADGNLWVTSWGSQEPLAPAPTIYPFENQESAIVVYLKDPSTGKLDFKKPLSYPLGNPFRATFDVAYNPVSKAMYVSCAGTRDKKKGISGVYKFALSEGEIKLEASWDVKQKGIKRKKKVKAFEGLRQIAFDSKGNVYVGAIKTGNTRVIMLTEDLKFVREFTENINRPWSVTIDKNDTIFAGNFGPKLVDGPSGKQLPLGSTGVAVLRKNRKGKYKSNLMTLPTGGDEVMLANGFPLYGVVKEVDYYFVPNRPTEIPVTPPCYSPLMRITSSTVDGAGNLWVNNNWKPSAANDLLLNPGGDGLVIFVGVAAPEPYRFG